MGGKKGWQNFEQKRVANFHTLFLQLGCFGLNIMFL